MRAVLAAFLAAALTFLALAAVQTPTHISAAAGTACSVAVSAFQPRAIDMGKALEHMASGQPHAGYPDLPQLRVGSTDPQLKAAAVPCVLMKAIGYLESSWRQAPSSVPAGTVGPGLVSRSCGYGVMQITSGMRAPGELPFAAQYSIASDYRYNIAWGAKMLADRWNLSQSWLPPVGDRNPDVIENWYYAVWSYNKWTSGNNPNNPDFPWPRPAYTGTQSRSAYPYQEMVWGLAANPPSSGGAPLWTAVPLTLPKREDVGVTPAALPMPDPAHASACATAAPPQYSTSIPWLSRTRR